MSEGHRKESARFLVSDSHSQKRTHCTPARHHLLSNQAPLASPERLWGGQHPLLRPGDQRAAAQQRRPPASTRLLLTGFPLTADFSELLRVPGSLLSPSCCCCCGWHSACRRRRCSFSRASSLSSRFLIPVRCLSRERRQLRRSRFPLRHSHQPAPACFAPLDPAAASRCLAKPPNADCANVFAAATASCHRRALVVYCNRRLQAFSQGPRAPFKSNRCLAFAYLCLLCLSPPGKLFLCSCSSHSRRRETSVPPGSSQASSNWASSCRSFF